MKATSITLLEQMKYTLQKRIPSAEVESVTSSISMNGEDIVYLFRIKKCPPIMIRSKKLEDVMELKGPPGVMDYIIKEITSAMKTKK